MFSIFNFLKFRKRENLGLIGKDPTDSRDYQLCDVQSEVAELPEEFDLRDKMTSIQKQNWGSCTSNMADGVKEFWDSKEYGKEIKLSQKFIYINTKKISGLWNNQGDYLRNAFKSVCEYGACLESTFPDIKRLSWEKYVKEEPSVEAYKEARRYKGKTFWAVGKTLENFKQAIFQNKCPVGFGMMWHSSYNKTAPDGKLPFPNKKAGGHAVICVGWTKDKLWVRNSWGTGYGKDGYFYIPFNEFTKHDIWNAYVLLDLENKPTNFEGWVANKYLRQSRGFKTGTKVMPIYNLNLRLNPTTGSQKLITLEKNKECEILDDEVVEANGYKWQHIRATIEE